MAKYIDIFSDYGFKITFGEEAKKNFLNSFLPAVVHIKDLTFKNTGKSGGRCTDRKAIYDIYCENERGEKFIFELKEAKQDYFIERSVYNWMDILETHR